MKNFTMVPNGGYGNVSHATVMNENGETGATVNISGKIINIMGSGPSCTVISEENGQKFATVYSLPDASPGISTRIN